MRYLLALVLVCLFVNPFIYAETKEEQANKNAQQSNSLAQSDPILYSYEIFKAIYNQNIEMTEILKDIRSILRENSTTQISRDQELNQALGQINDYLNKSQNPEIQGLDLGQISSTDNLDKTSPHE